MKKTGVSKKLRKRGTSGLSKDYAPNDELNMTTNEYGKFMNNTITEGGKRLMVNDSFKSDERRNKESKTTFDVGRELRDE